MTNQDDIRDQFSPLLDGELSSEERARVEAALARDADLLRELDALKRVDDLYRALPAENAPGDFEQAVRDRIRQSRPTVSAAAPRRLAPRRYWTAGLAAAAVLLIGVGAVFVNLGRLEAPKQIAALKSLATRPVPATEASHASDAAAPSAAVAEPQQNAPERFLQPEAAPSAGGATFDTKTEMPTAEQAAAPAPPIVAAREQAEVDRLEKAKGVGRLDGPGGRGAGEAYAGKPAPGPMAANVDIERKRALPSPAPAPAMADETARDGAAAGEKEVAGADAVTPAPPAASGIALDRAPATPPPPPASAPALAAPMPAEAPAPVTEALYAAPAKPARDAANAHEGGIMRLETPKLARVPEDKKDASTERTIGPRTFALRGGVWYETGYADEKTIELKRDSRATQRLLDQHAELKEVFALRAPVVFKIADRWYKLDAPKN